MKKIPALLLICVVSIANTKAQNVDLVSLGSSTFEIDSGSSFTPSQTVTGLTMNVTVANGDNFYNGPAAFTPISTANWSTQGFVNFGINMSLAGGSPVVLPFFVSFYDGSFDLIDTYEGSTSGLTSIGVSTPVTFSGISAPGSANYSSVQFLQFSWGDAGAVNVSASTVYGVVPEPSTYALLALGVLALGGYAMRRRQRA
jgi:hypothetical protein